MVTSLRIARIRRDYALALIVVVLRQAHESVQPPPVEHWCDARARRRARAVALAPP